MNQLTMFAAAVCCAAIGLTVAPAVAMQLLLTHSGMAAIALPGLLGLGLLGLRGLWCQGERATVFVGLVPAIVLDLWWLSQPFHIYF